MDRLPFDYMNAAGWVKTPELVAKVAKVPLTTHIVIGSFTVTPRPERTGGTAFDVLDDGTASNNLSLPNGGIPFLKAHGKEMVQIAHGAGKKVVLSGAPFSPEEDGKLAALAFEIGADEYESNRGCPNTDQNIISYNHELMESCDETVKDAIGTHYMWWRKVSPYANPRDREIEARLTRKSGACGAVTCNTFAGVRLRRAGKPIITAKDTKGLGGMSGTGIKYINHANAEHFCELLFNYGKKVRGVGGIGSGIDVEDYRAVGCAGAQVAAALFKSEDPGVLQKIGEEWVFAYGNPESV